TDPSWDTRFLGDLYQDLSEAARKKFALLQTPDFVEEFILDRTLEPALDEFGLEQDLGSSNHGKLSGFDDRNTLRIPFKMIDPACGSGHFLLGAFPRLLNRWRRKEPGTNIRELTQRALNSIHGVDINPFAVAIAKFRLLLVAMKSCDIRRLADAPAFKINVACGDSLLHGENRTSTGQRLWDYAEGATDEELYSHAYPGEDLQTVRTLLRPGAYHCVVANPPYIVPKDRKLNDWYRKRFSACHMKYSLAVPFMQQIFQLALQGGFTGQITANSFMKREFGKKLIESFFPTVDLTHVIDTSGAYIPGHGTPTTILLGRNRSFVGNTLRTVLGINGEPSTPADPAKGLVWSSILRFVDQSNSQNQFVSAGDSERALFHQHPWSIGGGGASQLKELIEENSVSRLSEKVDAIGPMAITALDEVFIAPKHTWAKLGIECRLYITGDCVRDWGYGSEEYICDPYDANYNVHELSNLKGFEKHVWLHRVSLHQRLMFGKTPEQAGLKWFEYRYLEKQRAKSSNLLTFPCVATHNHFARITSRVIANRHAPVIAICHKDSKELSSILEILNSSLACFWMKQVFFPKGGDHVGQEGARVRRTLWDERYEFTGTGLQSFPLPAEFPQSAKEQLHHAFLELESLTPHVTLASSLLEGHRSDEFTNKPKSVREALSIAGQQWSVIREKMIGYQENLDWECYQLYGLTDADAESTETRENVPIQQGERAFEIVLARKVKAGDSHTAWFERHSSTAITELPAHWPNEYKRVVERRIELIENDPNIRLIEQPEYKRRWNTEPWESQLERALREWLLLRLETYFDFDGRMTDEADASVGAVPLVEIAMYSVAQLADAARRDPQFMEVGELYRDDPAFDVQALVEELVSAESVPHLPVLRYKDSGLRKRAEWEKTWDLQRREDAGEAVGTIPVPPKYTSADFISTGGARYWALRGKLDVPKERWISFPHCEGPDGTLVICWAGYDHLQQAQAISAYYVRVQTEFGGSDDPRLIPLLASLIELLPWLAQWHNEPNANFDGLRMGDYFDGFVNEEARNMGKTLQEIKD
ncbi:MAG: BREX-2 system adenine-specific DNA-methyltransferase PglX, partial [Pirellula sp.]